MTSAGLDATTSFWGGVRANATRGDPRFTSTQEMTNVCTEQDSSEEMGRKYDILQA